MLQREGGCKECPVWHILDGQEKRTRGTDGQDMDQQSPVEARNLLLKCVKRLKSPSFVAVADAH